MFVNKTLLANNLTLWMSTGMSFPSIIRDGNIAINCMCLMAKLLLDIIISAIESVVVGTLSHLMMLILSQCIDLIIV